MTKSYIIVLNEGADTAKIKETVQNIGGFVTHEHPLINSLTVQLSGEDIHLFDLRSKHENLIRHIEEDQVMHIL